MITKTANKYLRYGAAALPITAAAYIGKQYLDAQSGESQEEHPLTKYYLSKYRSALLTDEEREALLRHYDLPEDTSLNARTYSRGHAAHWAGRGLGLAGGLVAYNGAKRTKAHKAFKANPPRIGKDTSILKALSPATKALLAGSLVVNNVASPLLRKHYTDKYSPTAARELLQAERSRLDKHAQESSKGSFGEKAQIAAQLGGGGYVTKRMLDRGHLTGREVIYHGTDALSAAKIRRKGLKPTTEATAGITNNLKIDPERYNAALGKSYATRSRLDAANYVMSRNMFREGMNGVDPSQVQAYLASEVGEKGIRNALRGVRLGTVKGNVPLWKYKTVMNPEAALPFDEWKYRTFGPIGNVTVPDYQARAAYNQLRKAVVVDGGIAPEHLRGAKYQRQGLRELGEFIRKNPARFAKGSVGAAAGLGLAGHGLSRIKNRMQGETQV